MIPTRVYRAAWKGAFVFHDSLLPRYRGLAPTLWAIVSGEEHTGMTPFEIAAEVDSGSIIDQQLVHIEPEDTIGDAIARVTKSYVELLEKNLPALLDSTATRKAQDYTAATYTCKRTVADGEIARAGGVAYDPRPCARTHAPVLRRTHDIGTT